MTSSVLKHTPGTHICTCTHGTCIHHAYIMCSILWCILLCLCVHTHGVCMCVHSLQSETLHQKEIGINTFCSVICHIFTRLKPSEHQSILLWHHLSNCCTLHTRPCVHMYTHNHPCISIFVKTFVCIMHYPMPLQPSQVLSLKAFVDVRQLKCHSSNRMKNLVLNTNKHIFFYLKCIKQKNANVELPNVNVLVHILSITCLKMVKKEVGSDSHF